MVTFAFLIVLRLRSRLSIWQGLCCYGRITSAYERSVRLEQLRFLIQTADSGFSISRAAETLNISQPAVSKQIRLLEEELRVELLVRREGRIVRLTEAGESIIKIARRMLDDAANIRRVSADFANDQSGQLTVATTQINARYVLREVVEKFRRLHPQVELRLRQGTPAEVADLLRARDADVAVTSLPAEGVDDVVALPSLTLQRHVIAPIGHPVLTKPDLSLADLAQYPIITLGGEYSGGLAVTRGFARADLRPNIAMTATDADLIKSYVEQGIGIALLPHVAFDAARDTKLSSRDVSELFDPTLVYACLHPGAYLRQFVFDFIHVLAPEWTKQSVMARLSTMGI